ncbi:peroxiredoxin [Sporosarcina sp. USHLN248]|uniref:peroxiredoxin n=1 Tax=Sporosarcina sp. USHLN248 TaxID=3081300 RepID=UPI003018569C
MIERIIGKEAPKFTMIAVLPDKSFGTVSLEENMNNGKWTVLFFYPLDFATICPSEITTLSDRYEEFEKLNAQLIGASTDTVYTHLAWINTKRKDRGLEQLNFPLASDRNQLVSRRYGVLITEEGITLRALFIISPEGILKYEAVFCDDIGRDVDETLRVLRALQIGGLTVNCEKQ